MKFTKQNLNKVKQSWWNFESKVENAVDIVKTHPKKIAAAVVISASLLSSAGWLVYNHTKPFGSCVLEAWYTQSLPWSKFQYRIFTSKCMANRGTEEHPKWVEVKRVLDVSTGADSDVDMDDMDMGE